MAYQKDPASAACESEASSELLWGAGASYRSCLQGMAVLAWEACRAPSRATEPTSAVGFFPRDFSRVLTADEDVVVLEKVARGELGNSLGGSAGCQPFLQPIHSTEGCVLTHLVPEGCTPIPLEWLGAAMSLCMRWLQSPISNSNGQLGCQRNCLVLWILVS